MEPAWTGKVKVKFGETCRASWTGYDTIFRRHSKPRSDSDSHQYHSTEYGSESIEGAIQFGSQVGFL